MKKLIQLLLLFAVLQFQLLAEVPGYSTEGSTIPYLQADYLLQQPLGVRSLGVGGAQTGRADDLSAMRYNPAGLSLMGYWEYGFDFHENEQHTQNASALLSAPLPYGTLGFRYTDYYVRDNDQVADGSHAHPDKSNQAYLTGLSYGLPVYGHYVHAGATMNYFSSQWYYPGEDKLTHSRGIFLDLGAIAEYDISDLGGMFTYLPGVSVGASIRNLHPGFKIDNEIYDQYTREYSIGGSLYYDYRFMLNVDMVVPEEAATEWRYGAEWWPFYFLALRGGVVLTGEPNTYRATTFGFGLGDSITCSKMSFEYAGEVRMPDGFSSKEEVLHSFAIHHSFEKLRKDSKCRSSDRVAVAMTDRYTERYRFAKEIPPGDIIDDTIAAINQESEETVVESVPVDADPAPIQVAGETIRPQIVGYFPLAIEFVSSDPYENHYRDQLRDPIILFIKDDKHLKSVSDLRYKLPQPKKEAAESDVDYLNRLSKFHNAKMLVFGTLVVDERKRELTIKLVYHRSGDTEISSLVEYSGKIEKMDKLAENLRHDFVLQVNSLLDLALEE